MVISRRWAGFLIGVGVWTWLIWPRFGLAIWQDKRSFSGSSPTAFLGVHAVLIVASLAVGTTVGLLGVRAWRAGRPGTGRSAEAGERAVRPGAGRSAEAGERIVRPGAGRSAEAEEIASAQGGGPQV